jgi:S-(hydroxymethyl)glutathione dehydrogenase/alcohol dehydrogenase
MRAVVVDEFGSGARLEEVGIDEPGPGEVLVRMKASGICGSDLHVLHGTSNAGAFPCVLGHEGAGVIEAVGAGVALPLGTAVIISMGASCGRCARCAVGDAVLCEDPGRANRLQGLMGDGTPRVHRDGTVLHPFVGCGTLAELAVLPAHEVVPLPEGVPFEIGAIAACGVTTGLGAALTIAQVRAGATALVIGCGGVGLNVVQGCRLAGASRIVAVDTSAAKLELARRFGATDVVDPASGPLADAVRALVPGGVDYAFEVVGVPELVTQAFELTRAGGTCVAVGSCPPGSTITITTAALFPQRRLLGCMAGGNVPRRDLARIAGLYRSGRIELDALIGARLPLDRIDDAIAAAESGDIARAVITF